MNKTIWVVNQFAGTPESGWGERHFYLAKHWINEGYDVFIVSSANNHMFSNKRKVNRLFTQENYSGVNFIWVWTPNYNPKTISRFLPMLFFSLAVLFLPLRSKQKKPNYLIHSSMSIFPVFSVYFLKKFFKAEKFVFEVRDLWPLTPIHLLGYNKKNFFIRVIGFFERFGYKRADCVVSVLEESEKYINEIAGKKVEFTYIPNGYDTSLLENHDIGDFHVPDEKFIVGYTGTIGFANALDPFFECIVSQELSDFHFVFVGDGYLKEEYQNKVNNFSNVDFIPKVPKEKVGSYIQKFDLCFISWHSSELYKYGVSANKYFDYMSRAKPILSAQKGIIDPVMKSGCGLVVDNDPQSICKGLIQFINMNSRRRQELGDKGLSYLESNHLFSSLSKKYLNALTA